MHIHVIVSFMMITGNTHNINIVAAVLLCAIAKYVAALLVSQATFLNLISETVASSYM